MLLAAHGFALKTGNCSVTAPHPPACILFQKDLNFTVWMAVQILFSFTATVWHSPDFVALLQNIPQALTEPPAAFWSQ